MTETQTQVDPLRACKDAKDRMERADNKLRRHAPVFQLLARGLSVGDPIRIKFANSGLFTPSDLPDDFLVNYDAYPSREEFKVELEEHYAALTEYRQARHRLAPGERSMFAEL